MLKKLSIIPTLLFLLLTQGCYTQLAWFHQTEPEQDSSFSVYDPYGLNEIERSSDFIPYSQNPYGRGDYGRYGYDPNFWSYYGDYGSPFGLYSPYSSHYSRNRLFSPYGYGDNRYGYYPYSTGYGLASPVLVNESTVQSPRNWNRGDMSSSGSNLVIRREVPLMMITAQPIRKQSPNPKLIMSPYQLKDSNVSSLQSSYNNSTPRSWNGGSFSGSGSSGKSSSSSSRSSSSGRVTRRR